MAGGRVGGVAVLVACGLLVALAFPAAAPAARGLVTGFQGDDFQSADPALRALWLDRAKESEAGILRIVVPWETVAGPLRPTDPTNPRSASYDFSSIDPAIRDAEAHGLSVMLNVGPPTPAWAEAPGRPASAGPGRWKPIASDLADFVQAVAARYSGGFDPDDAGPVPPLPAVQALELWNEPNGEVWLTPQFQGSPDYYREMLNASYKAAKAVNPRILIVAAGTGPYGDPPGGPYPPTGARVRPVEFWQQVLCVHPVKSKKGKKGKKGKKRASGEKLVRTQGCNAPAMFDVLAHHPIDNTGGGPHQSGPTKNDASTPDLGRIVRVLRAAERAGTVSRGGHPVWVTEFWWDSNPPNPSGAPLGVQARWIEESLYLFWKAGASVAINFVIHDTTTRPNVHAGFQGGVFFIDGRRKPAFTAFRFPFVTERINKQLLRAWGRAPAAGKLVIQRRQGGRWVAIRKIQVSEGAVFDARLRLSGKQRLRAQVAGDRSLVWKQG